MTSTAGSTTLSPSAVKRAAVVTHGKRELVGSALAQLEELTRAHGVEIVEEDGDGPPADADLAVVLGGDGTMLRALRRFLGTRTPVIGVNFGRVGFLASMQARDLEAGLGRAFAGDFRVYDLPTLDARADGASGSAVNDVVAVSTEIGRIAELEWDVGGEPIDVQPCDGIICATPSGSTAYNLSNGGPVIVWGVDAMAVTFVAPHSLDARPLVVPRGRDVEIVNRSVDVSVTALIDGHRFADLAPGDSVKIGLGPRHSRLAMLPEMTFFRRYRETFAS
jgi:NAD+ kinase